MSRPYLVFLTGVALLSIASLASSCKRPAAGTEGRTAGSAIAATDPNPAFWIWYRSSALSSDENASLMRAMSGGVAPRLYREIAEFGWKEDRWAPRPLSPEAPDLLEGIIPVVRLDPGPALFDHGDTATILARWLRHYFPRGVPTELQLDYDCPVRLLPRYASLISGLRRELGLKSISVTALVSWIDAPRLSELAAVVDEMVPMFYDMTADRAEDIAAGRSVPMSGSEAETWLRRWKECRTPWRAGFPNFERLSLFEATGKPLGHLRLWSPENLELATYLQPISGWQGGFAWRITRDAGMQGTALRKGQLLVWRAPDDDEIRRIAQLALSSGARGIVWFALPGPGLRAWHTPAHLAALQRGESPRPQLTCHSNSDGTVVLRNAGPGDLNWLAGRPFHGLLLSSPNPGAFDESGSGGFFRILSSSPPGAPSPHSVKSLLSFTQLQGGQDLTTESGLIQPAKTGDVRWSVDDFSASPLSSP